MPAPQPSDGRNEKSSTRRVQPPTPQRSDDCECSEAAAQEHSSTRVGRRSVPQWPLGLLPAAVPKIAGHGFTLWHARPVFST